ncbi:hypothetical protein CBR_g48883 [Chara braunii]|uniref:Helicase ATP-binding domain-containing protein n=1 Tax=Chara braunii TaxID=69332 RepID=A0A388M3V4_CHABU|nr:hypothetical protein CBR_g48883 [Chara braunii]|eukprot:GBG89175.1 hypothetical protein CBR_g48883 [Chara braunii]
MGRRNLSNGCVKKENGLANINVKEEANHSAVRVKGEANGPSICVKEKVNSALVQVKDEAGNGTVNVGKEGRRTLARVKEEVGTAAARVKDESPDATAHVKEEGGNPAISAKDEDNHATVHVRRDTNHATLPVRREGDHDTAHLVEGSRGTTNVQEHANWHEVAGKNVVNLLDEDEEKDANIPGSPSIHLDEEDSFMTENGLDPLVTGQMAEEERRLMEERAKEDTEEMEKALRAADQNGDAKNFDLLDVLLNKTQIYSKFLLERMEDIKLDAKEEHVEEANGKPQRGRKRKAGSTAGQAAARKKANTANASSVAQAKLQNAIAESNGASTKCGPHVEEDEAVRLEEQKLLTPLLTGGILKSYQLKGVKWLVSLWQNGLNGILADQMGLGKTVQCIGFLCHLRGKGIHGPFLVCGPLSTLSNWVNEIKRFAPTIPCILYHGSKEERAALREKYMPAKVTEDFPVVVTSYEIVMNDRKYLQRHVWKYIVVDEVGLLIL